MSDLRITGPIASRQFHLEEVCHASEGHTHNYDHTTIVIRGRIRVTYAFDRDGQRVEGESREFGQGEHVCIKAAVYHTIKALEPDTLYQCIFSHRDFDGLVTQTYTGNSRAYA